jgi:hypothetical protein
MIVFEWLLLIKKPRSSKPLLHLNARWSFHASDNG